MVRVVRMGAHPAVVCAPEPGQWRERFYGDAVESEVPVAAERRAHPLAVDGCSTVATSASPQQSKRGAARGCDRADSEVGCRQS